MAAFGDDAEDHGAEHGALVQNWFRRGSELVQNRSWGLMGAVVGSGMQGSEGPPVSAPIPSIESSGTPNPATSTSRQAQPLAYIGEIVDPRHAPALP